MKTILKYTTIIIAFICFFSNIIYAQSLTDNRIVRESLDEMFESLDKSKVPTGYLLDYAMDLVEFERYNGTELTDSNYVDISVFEDILSSLKSASTGTTTLDDIAQIITALQSAETTSGINIAYAGYKYNYIKASALADNLISYNSGRVSDRYINGVWQNPYDEAYIFGFTPGFCICHTGTVSFNFPENLKFSNIPHSSLRFDAGDGTGYRDISTSSSISATYTSAGKKELKLSITVAGQILEAHSSMLVIDANHPDYSPVGSLNWHPVDSVEIYSSNTYTGTRVGAQITTYLRKGRSRLTKTFIVVEGFDPWRLSKLLGDLPAKAELGSICHRDFMEDIHEYADYYDYDFIYIDWFDSTEDIRDNADLLIEIIREISRRKTSDSCTERTVIMGQSMGGLVARLALCKMEKTGEAHGISSYISHDSPHLGANIPLGALYFTHHALSLVNGYNTAVNLADFFLTFDIYNTKKTIWDVLHSPAVKQMLVNHIGTDGILDNSAHNEWQEFLNGTGFPQGDIGYPIERLCIVNGAPHDQSDIFNRIGQHYLYLEGSAKTKFLGDIAGNILSAIGLNSLLSDLDLSYLSNAITYWGSSKFRIHAEINPFISNGSLISKLQVKYTKKYLWLVSKTYTVFSEDAYSPSTGLPYDSFAGSKYTLPSFEIKEPEKNVLVKFNIDFGLTDRFMFIPAASALCRYNASASDYTYDFYINPPIPTSQCPFDAYYLAEDIQSHIHMDRSILNWLNTQLQATISGDDNARTGSTYTVTGYYDTVSWSTSDSSIATIDNSGKLTAQGNGLITITAQSYSNGRLFRKTKDVLVNFPEMVIRKSYILDKGYVFSARCVNSKASEILDKLVNEENLKYEWSLLDGNGELTTKVTSDNTFAYLPKNNESISVTLRLVSADGRKGEIKRLSLKLQSLFATNYEYVIVSGHCAYFIKSDGTYEKGLPSEEFSVTYKNIACNPEDNPNTDLLVNKYMKGTDCFIAYSIEPWPDGYLAGIKTNNILIHQWRFQFFNLPIFLNPLEYALNNSNGSEKTMFAFNMTICNSLKMKMQRIPFVLISKPSFPNN